MLDSVRGIIFGDMAQCVISPQDLERMKMSLRHALQGFTGPIAIGLRSGHVSSANITLPLGVEVSLELGGGSPRLQFLEPAVRG